jgi:hypothetical protein
MAEDMGKRAAALRHELYLQFESDWRKLADVLEGTGGFKSGARYGGYLVAHPREWQDHTAATPQVPTKKLLERRRLARYENFASAILKQTMTALFREAPTRILGKTDGKPKQANVKPQGIEAWWLNVEGKKARKVDIDAFMNRAWKAAATFGHMLIYMDRSIGEATTAADMPQPVLRAYTPLDVADWLEDEQGNLTEVKLLEPEPRESFTSRQSSNVRYRCVDEESWTLYDHNGKRLESGEHRMGTLPCVELFAERRLLYQHVGLSLFGDGQLHIDHFNLISELRELFRKQAFSILNIPLGSGDQAMSAQSAKELLNEQVSTEGVLFSGLAAQFISADAANLVAYMDHIQQLVRTIYRLAGVFFESDSKDAEAEGSLKLKREDMSQRLSGFATELETADEAIAELWYRAEYGDNWEPTWESDQVMIQYPDSFDMTPFDVVLEQAEAAMSLGYPPEVLKAIRKLLLPKFLPSLGPKQQQELENAIDSSEEDVTPMEKQRAELKAMMAKPPVAA